MEEKGQEREGDRMEGEGLAPQIFWPKTAHELEIKKSYQTYNK